MTTNISSSTTSISKKQMANTQANSHNQIDLGIYSIDSSCFNF